MKLTKETLKKIIKEELEKVITEQETEIPNEFMFKNVTGGPPQPYAKVSIDFFQTHQPRMNAILKLGQGTEVRFPEGYFKKGVECHSQCQSKFNNMNPAEIAIMILDKSKEFDRALKYKAMDLIRKGVLKVEK